MANNFTHSYHKLVLILNVLLERLPVHRSMRKAKLKGQNDNEACSTRTKTRPSGRIMNRFAAASTDGVRGVASQITPSAVRSQHDQIWVADAELVVRRRTGYLPRRNQSWHSHWPLLWNIRSLKIAHLISCLLGSILEHSMVECHWEILTDCNWFPFKLNRSHTHDN